MSKMHIVSLAGILFFSLILLSGCTPIQESEEGGNALRINKEDLKENQSNKPSKKELLSQEKSSEDTFQETSKPKEEDTMKNKQYENPPSMQIDKKNSYAATLKTTKGDIVIELFAEKTPQTVNNFVFLSREGFYDQVIFHRIIEGFMIQGGDPTRTGAGGPGYVFDDEPFSGEYSRGTVAMANSGPDTNGSQFFIMHKDNPLPPNYVIFGEVVEGMDTVDEIAKSPVEPNPSGEESSPTELTFIESIEIQEE